MEQNITFFWVGWAEESEDFKPLNNPPDKVIIDWWHSGFDDSGKARLRALVAAKSHTLAISAIKLEWPGFERAQLSFLRPKAKRWRPDEERYPLSLRGSETIDFWSN